MIAALFIEREGIYWNHPSVDPWDITRDARRYADDLPVVAHPPCHLWVNLAAVNWKRYARQKPAWYPGGDDGGCFSSALANVIRCGGVLEHPAMTHAWDFFGILKPQLGLWSPRSPRVWVTEVWQSAYGHRARKRTWLLYAGNKPPFDLDWRARAGSAQIGWFDRIKPSLSKREVNATPKAFRDMLIDLAEHSR